VPDPNCPSPDLRLSTVNVTGPIDVSQTSWAIFETTNLDPGESDSVARARAIKVLFSESLGDRADGLHRVDKEIDPVPSLGWLSAFNRSNCTLAARGTPRPAFWPLATVRRNSCGSGESR
jgi:hypothetical protein